MYELLAQTTYTYSTSTSQQSSSGLGAFAIAVSLIGLIIAVIAIVAMWKIFVKAGQPGWKAIIPGYNSWTLAEIAGKPGWWGIVGLAGAIPLVGFIASIAAFVLYIIIALELAKKFGKSSAFAVFGLIIFSIVGLLILGFGDAKYDGTATTAAPSTPGTTPTPPAAKPPTETPSATPPQPAA